MGLRDLFIKIMTENTNGLDDQFIYILSHEGRWRQLHTVATVIRETEKVIPSEDLTLQYDNKMFFIYFETKAGIFVFKLNTNLTTMSSDPEFLECIQRIRSGTKRVLFDEENLGSNFLGDYKRNPFIYRGGRISLAYKPLNPKDLDILEDECIQKFVNQLFIGGEFYVGEEMLYKYIKIERYEIRNYNSYIPFLFRKSKL